MPMDADHAMQSLSINNKSVDKGYLNISWLERQRGRGSRAGQRIKVENVG
jgi:hypothetical protein